MGSRNIAAEIGQLSRLQFGKAARRFYWSLLIEVLASFVSAAALFFAWRGEAGLFASFAVSAGLVVSYVLRWNSSQIYDSAEKMRRQALLTEGLGWPIRQIAASEWMRSAGYKLARRTETEPLPDDYYASIEDKGPARLSELVAESAFYTRHLYGNVLYWLRVSLFLVATFLIMAFGGIALQLTSYDDDALIAQTVMLIVALVVGLDIFGWMTKVQSLVDEVRSIEDEIEALETIDIASVMRLVMEYNCVLTSGFPVLDWMFDRWHDEIDQFWRAHRERTS